MTDTRSPATWLRSLAGLLTLAGALALSGCGGGSGAPNNPYAAPVTGSTVLGVFPAAVDLYVGVATTLTVSGGQSPYTVASSNTAALTVAATVSGSTITLLPNAVAADTNVVVTVRDAAGTVVTATAVVHASTLVTGMTVTPSASECGDNAICSGQNGTALVKVQAPNGAPLAGRSVRYDVVGGPFGIVSTAAGSPIVSSLTVVSDAFGDAKVLIKANLDASTQRAQLRATDVAGGQQVTGDFLIQQVTDGTKVLSVVPGTSKIAGPYNTTCSTNFRVDYYIYGGTPPYRVTPSAPTAIAILNSIVSASGGFFEAVTNGTCVDPLTFSIVDAAGLQTTATLSNVVGSATNPANPPPTLAVTPSDLTPVCASATFTYAITGGTPPYNVYASPSFAGPSPLITPQVVDASGATTKVSNVTQDVTVFFVDSGSPQQHLERKIDCP